MNKYKKDQDLAAGGTHFRKVCLEDGTIVTASVSTTNIGHQQWAYLRFKTGQRRFRGYIGKVTSESRDSALKLGWKLAREKKLVEKYGWAWVIE